MMQRLYGWILVLVIGVAAPAGMAADLRPSWECLPADTFFMARMPNLAEFWKTIQSRTKFGSVVLSPKRLEGMWQALAQLEEDEGETSLEQFEEGLEKYGMEMADLTHLCGGEIGTGIVARPREGDEPLLMMLVWVEPGEEVAQKLLAATRQSLEESADEEHGPQRTDMELAGREVMMIIEPELATDDDESDEPEGTAAKMKIVGERHAYVTVAGGRFLIGVGITKFGGPEKGDDDAEAMDEIRRIFATFLEAHAADGEAALAGVYREPAIAAATLPGVPLVEMMFMPKVVVAALVAESGQDESEMQRQLALSGVDDIGSVVLRQNFDDGRWRGALAVTMPSPRHGMLAMLDQPCDASEVPGFVTREVSEFGQISLDLGKAYASIRQLLLAQADGEQIANMFSVADMQSQAWLGMDVAPVLSGLGSRHWFLTFPPQVAKVIAKARVAEDTGEDATTAADRIAAVWQLADDAPFLKLLGRLAPLVGAQVEEEQGFKGFRVQGAAALYVGRGHLVMAIGEDVLERTLASIRTPPQGETSLRESDVPGRAAAILPAEPGRYFGVSDSTKSGGTLGTLRDLAEAMEPDDFDDEKMRSAFVAFKQLLPAASEMEGMFGIGAALLQMTDDGLLGETAWEMPAP